MSGAPTVRPSARAKLVEGAVVGAGFGFAAATAEVTLWTVGLLRRGLASPRDALLSSVVLSVVLGFIVGALTSPLLRSTGARHRSLQLLAVFFAWAALGLAAGLPSLTTYVVLLVVPWVLALAFTSGARVLATRRPGLRYVPLALGIVVLAGALLAPSLSALGAEQVASDDRRENASSASGPDVLIVVLDTVRADHVGVYGYERETTPNLDSIAADGVVFADATAPATWSLPSHASLFTGVFPATHGAHSEHRALSHDGPPTLAEVLAGHGYETRCFTANAWFSDELGLVRGFRHTDEAWRSGRAGQSRFFALRLLDRLGFGADDNGGGAVVEDFEAWADAAPVDGPPTFAFVNLIEAHFPYHQVPAEHLARFTDRDESELRALSLALMEAQFGGEPPDPERARGPATDMYDAGVHYADHLLGRLVDALRRRGTLDQTIVVVLSDHGELLGEHGAFGHGASLHREETRVPLVVRYPSALAAGTRVTTPVSTVGVFATVLDLAALGPAPQAEVGSLREVVEGAGAGLVVSERYALPEGHGGSGGETPLFRRDRRFRTYRDGELKLTLTSEGERFLYDLSTIEAEARDVARERPEVAARLDGQLRVLASGAGLSDLDGAAIDAPELELDDETRERLRALGYIE